MKNNESKLKELIKLLKVGKEDIIFIHKYQKNGDLEKVAVSDLTSKQKNSNVMIVTPRYDKDERQNRLLFVLR